MKWLITGGAGFIGSNFVYYLLSHYPHDGVVCMDALTYAGHIHTLQAAMADPRFVFVKGDISVPQDVMAVFTREKPDVVVNFAAESHVDRSIAAPTACLKTNVMGVSVLMDACLQAGVKRFHQISTDEVYGDVTDNCGYRFDEAAPLRPSSPYSATKAAADMLVLAYRRTYGLPCTISRSGNNYGRYQLPEKLIPLAIVGALADRPLPLYGDGKQTRNWLHVDDYCRAVDLIVRQGKDGGVYNVSGVAKANIEVVRQILSLLGKDEHLVRHVSDRPGHDRQYAVDDDALRRELGWQPLADWDTGIAETVQWYRAHPEWWQPVVEGEYRNYYNGLYPQQ